MNDCHIIYSANHNLIVSRSQPKVSPVEDTEAQAQERRRRAALAAVDFKHMIKQSAVHYVSAVATFPFHLITYELVACLQTDESHDIQIKGRGNPEINWGGRVLQTEVEFNHASTCGVRSTNFPRPNS